MLLSEYSVCHLLTMNSSLIKEYFIHVSDLSDVFHAVRCLLKCRSKYGRFETTNWDCAWFILAKLTGAILSFKFVIFFL